MADARSNPVHNYALMMQCNTNPLLAAWVKENLTGKLDKLTLKLEEFNKGPSLTLLFVGDNGLHALCNDPQKYASLKEDIDRIINEHHAMVMRPLSVKSVEKLGRFKQVIALRLEQENEILLNLNVALKKMLQEKYNVTASTEFSEFKPHVSVAQTETTEIPDALLLELNQALKTMEHKTLTIKNQTQLSRRDGFGATAPTCIVDTFTVKKPKGKRPLVQDVEAFLEPHRVTGFACNIGEDILLLAAKITDHVALSSTDFLPPDFALMTITYKQLSESNAEVFLKFLREHDSTATLENKGDNGMVFTLGHDACHKNIVPIFKRIFLEKVDQQPHFLDSYQEQSAPYFPSPTSAALQQTTASSSPRVSQLLAGLHTQNVSLATRTAEPTDDANSRPTNKMQ